MTDQCQFGRLFDDNYFLRYRSSEIAWHTEWLADPISNSDIGSSTFAGDAQGTALKPCCLRRETKHTFAQVTAVLDELGHDDCRCAHRAAA